MFSAIRRYRLKREIAQLETVFRQAKDAFEAAVNAGDTRAQHTTWLALRAAKTELVRAEIELSFLYSRRRSRAVTPKLARGLL